MTVLISGPGWWAVFDFGGRVSLSRYPDNAEFLTCRCGCNTRATTIPYLPMLGLDHAYLAPPPAVPPGAPLVPLRAVLQDDAQDAARAPRIIVRARRRPPRVRAGRRR